MSDSVFNAWVAGEGSREFAFARRLLRDSPDVRVTLLPGLSGMIPFFTEEELERVTFYDIPSTNVRAIAQKVKEERPDLLIGGAENPLALGLANLTRKYTNVLGHTRAGMQMETNKRFCKSVYQKLGFKTPYAVLVTSLEQALRHLAKARKRNQPKVLKYVGLAYGKGVNVVPIGVEDYWERLEQFARAMFDPESPLYFGKEGILIEDQLDEDMSEFSAIHMVGPNGFILPFVTAKDHKLFNGKQTGGMGIVCWAPGFGQDVVDASVTRVLDVMDYLQRKRGIELCGIYYEGMARVNGVDQALEVNGRGGGPETEGQLEFFDGEVPFHEICLATVRGTTSILENVRMRDDMVLVGVVMASLEYPDDYSHRKGGEVIIPENLPENVTIFPAGLKYVNGKLEIAGGRVMMVTAEVIAASSDPDKTAALKEAREIVMSVVEAIEHGGNLGWRKDIGLLEAA